MNTRDILEKLNNKEITVDEALISLKMAPFVDLGFAKLDTHRQIRQGMPEVIYGAGKTREQIAEITKTLLENRVETVLITRVDRDKSDYIINQFGKQATYYEIADIVVVGVMPKANSSGTIVVATGGTSDMPVAEEAAITAECYGNKVVRLYDVGVAGLHRLLSHAEEIMNANVIIAIAGMEGALASVIGGLADCPVIAVPTSVGYGANFEGLSALLSMINSCASGVSVVNIDNGFGAGYQASMINQRR